MGWIDDYEGETIGLDTAPLIYFIEEHPSYIEQVQCFFESMAEDRITVVTSTITLLEVLVHPLREGQQQLADEYKDILLHSQLITLDISYEISEGAAQLRAAYGIRTPDAIQIAASVSTGAKCFFTNDKGLPEIPNIRYLTLNRT